METEVVRLAEGVAQILERSGHAADAEELRALAAAAVGGTGEAAVTAARAIEHRCQPGWLGERRVDADWFSWLWQLSALAAAARTAAPDADD